MNPNTFWNAWRPASCLPDCWCEMPRYGHAILEPTNTWTNMAMVMVGFFVLYQGTQREKLPSEHPLRRTPSFFTMFALAMIILGLGSFWFHASLTFLGQWTDNVGMYFVSNFFLVYQLDRVYRWTSQKTWSIYLLVTLPFIALAYFMPETRRSIFAVSLVAAILATIYSAKKVPALMNKKLLYGAAASYLFAQTWWLLDKYKIICDPTHWFNGHGVWHIFVGVACYSFFLYLKSERSLSTDTN
jgi:hypothetical protein